MDPFRVPFYVVKVADFVLWILRCFSEARICSRYSNSVMEVFVSIQSLFDAFQCMTGTIMNTISFLFISSFRTDSMVVLIFPCY